MSEFEKTKNLLDFVFIAIGVGFGLFIGAINMQQKLQREAIEHHVAQHNPVTGDFEWIEPEKKP